jgi:hypothetical protein
MRYALEHAAKFTHTLKKFYNFKSCTAINVSTYLTLKIQSFEKSINIVRIKQELEESRWIPQVGHMRKTLVYVHMHDAS